MQEYNICFSLDSKYTEQFTVSAVSILKNADADENINFYILNGGLTEKDKSNIELLKNIKSFNIEYIEINEKDFKDCPMLKEKSDEHKDYHVTVPTYFRFKLPELLPKLDKVLYLDCDVIVRTSLKELFAVSLKDKAVAMVEDVESKREAERLTIKKYFNAGVMLINLDYWRKNDVSILLFEYAKKNKKKILWQDQDVINVVLEGKIKSINLKWNYQYFLYDKTNEKDLAECSILHLAGRFKPWLIPFEHFIYDYYYYFLALTPFKNRIIDYKQKASGKHLKNDIGGNTTNILLDVLSDDVQKIYQEITKNYEYTNSLSIQADEKIGKVYEEISKNYEYTNTLKDEVKAELNQHIDEVINAQTEVVIAQTDEKIGKVYEEISKNYEYTNTLKDEVKAELNQHFDEVINAQAEVVAAQTDEKIGKVYEEISKNYEYTNTLKEEVKVELNQHFDEVINAQAEVVTAQTDEKIGKVYDEITKNYEYTNEIRDNLSATLYKELSNKENSFNEKLIVVERNLIQDVDATKSDLVSRIEEVSNSSVLGLKELKTILDLNIDFTKKELTILYEKIAFNDEVFKKDLNELRSEFIKLLNDKLEYFIAQTNARFEDVIAQTDEKIGRVYDEISKNYEYTKQLVSESDYRTDKVVAEAIENVSHQTDEKIGKVYDEVSRNYEYTNKLAQENKDLTYSLKADVEKQLFKAKDDMFTYIDHANDVVSNKLDNLRVDVEGKIADLEETQNRKNNLKISEVYTYTNSELTKVFATLNKNNSNYENKLEHTQKEAYRMIEESKNEISNLKVELDKKKEIEADFNKKLENVDLEHKKQVEVLTSEFEERFNNQRIKYENKLMKMEEQITDLEAKYAESQKGFFTKMIERCKKR